MKILCVIDDLGSGGAQRQIVELSKGFKKHGYDVAFLTYHKDDFYKSELLSFGINITCIEESNYFFRVIKMRSFIRNGNYDIVLSFLEGANFISTIAGFPSKRWKLIVGERSANPAILKSFKLKFYRWIHLFSDYIVSNSISNLEMVTKICPILPKGKCKVIYNNIDFDKWKEEKVDYIYKKDGKFLIVVASTHQYLKNLIGLVEAVNLMSQQDKSYLKIEWYGDIRIDNSKSDALKLIDEYNLENVFTFFEATHDICKVMNRADAIGLFSLYEGLPNTICEGMTLGKPIISTNVSDIKYLIEDEISGFLCNPNDYQDIAYALTKIINLPKDELLLMGRINKNKSLSLFEKTIILEQYIKLFSN
jgi:glycosyltransferase involved in cell wall biosynthesis